MENRVCDCGNGIQNENHALFVCSRTVSQPRNAFGRFLQRSPNGSTVSLCGGKGKTDLGLKRVARNKKKRQEKNDASSSSSSTLRPPLSPVLVLNPKWTLKMKID